MEAYTHLGALMLEAVKVTGTLHAAFAFLSFVLFVFAVAVKEEGEVTQKADVVWSTFAVLCTFVVTTVAFFVLDTPLSGGYLQEIAFLGLSNGLVFSILVALAFVGVSFWLFMPKSEMESKVKFEAEDDLSSAPFIGGLLGFALCGFTFLGQPWNALLMEHANALDAVGQSAFYAFVFALVIAVVWGALFTLIRLFFGKVITSFLPVYFVALFTMMMGVSCLVLLFIS